MIQRRRQRRFQPLEQTRQLRRRNRRRMPDHQAPPQRAKQQRPQPNTARQQRRHICLNQWPVPASRRIMHRVRHQFNRRARRANDVRRQIRPRRHHNPPIEPPHRFTAPDERLRLPMPTRPRPRALVPPQPMPQTRSNRAERLGNPRLDRRRRMHAQPGMMTNRRSYRHHQRCLLIRLNLATLRAHAKRLQPHPGITRNLLPLVRTRGITLTPRLNPHHPVPSTNRPPITRSARFTMPEPLNINRRCKDLASIRGPAKLIERTTQRRSKAIQQPFRRRKILSAMTNKAGTTRPRVVHQIDPNRDHAKCPRGLAAQ